jgi:hypothetical protein
MLSLPAGSDVVVRVAFELEVVPVPIDVPPL